MPTPHRGPALALAVLFAAMPALAQAQTGSPTGAVAPPKPTCTAPRIIDRMSVPTEDVVHLEAQANAYASCMKAYIDARQAAADVDVAQARAEADAGNAAAHQANDVYAQVRAFAAKQGQ